MKHDQAEDHLGDIAANIHSLRHEYPARFAPLMGGRVWATGTLFPFTKLRNSICGGTF